MNKPHPDSLKGRLKEWRLRERQIELQNKLKEVPLSDKATYALLRDDLRLLNQQIEAAHESDKVVRQEFADRLKT